MKDFIYPLFVLQGKKISQPLPTMPGLYRYSPDMLIEHLHPLVEKGLAAIALFPVVDAKQKTSDACEAYNPNGLVQTTVRSLKKTFPELVIITDVALDPYTSHGQDGVIDSNGYVLNDETTDILVRQALSHAQCGADMIAPSDMMDGRIGAIRDALEQERYINTTILSYAVKYASAFYGPFRDAVNSASALGNADKKTYQMDTANAREAIGELQRDVDEGADLVMVKPAMPYLDIINKAVSTIQVPVFAYQVSGEYAMLQQAINQGLLPQSVIAESLTAIKRAGASAIFSYYTAWCLEHNIGEK